tara:strand:- start:63 stop:2579 length:2517 start_codon:yes stop_codon:yes gene_type:complete
MCQTKFNKIKLINNSKNPANKWSNSSNWIKDDVLGNYGIVCGKKNNVMVIDLDIYKWGSEHIFLKQDFNFSDCYTVDTANGGKHLYFEYDEHIKTCTNSVLGIDIRSDGSYIVGPSSEIDGKKYEVSNNVPIGKIPADLKDFVLKYVMKSKPEIVKTEAVHEWSYNFDNENLMKMVNELSRGYTEDYDDWFKLATFLKEINRKDIFDKVGEGYNKKNNDKIWDVIKCKYSMIPHFVSQSSNIEYYKYKAVEAQKARPDKVINKKKLGYDFFETNKNYVVKSDTGTGKTTSVKHLIKDHNLKFISIVSRVSLADEQYEVFSKHGIDCQHYQKTNLDSSCIIQVDSLLKIARYDFSNYCIFLDEYNSLVEYLVTCDLLNATRVPIFLLLCKILRQCKQVIATDADISDNTMKLLNFCNVQYQFIENEYKHNDNKKAEEIFDYDEFVELIKQEEKYIVCTDSLTQANKLNELLKDDSVKLITSETEGYVNLDDYDKIIYSPKIIYGLDSTIVRPVFCLYNSGTINPRAMVQQICRSRHLTEVKYLFINKKVYNPKYSSLTDCKDYIKSVDNHGAIEFGLCTDDETNNLYLEMLSNIMYSDDSYKTNVFLHFKMLLKQRGFKDANLISKTELNTENFKSKIKLRKLENFDVNDQQVKKINEYLKVDDEQMENYKEYFVDPIMLRQHFSISNYFFKNRDDIEISLHNKQDFNVKKLQTERRKYIWLKDILEKTNSLDGLNPMNDLNESDVKKLASEYDLIFKKLKTKINLNSKYEITKLIAKTYKHLFGNDIIESQRGTRDGQRIIEYKLNQNIIDENRSLFKFRESKQDEKTLDVNYLKFLD